MKENAGKFKVGACVVEPDLHSLSGPEGVVHVEPRVMGVLVRLAQRAGETVSKADLLRTVWQDQHVTDDAVHRAVAVLRKLLADCAAEQTLIQTVPKKGYRLLAPVQPLHPDSLRKTHFELTLDAVLASCTDHIYVYDREERYLHASEAGAQALGLTADRMKGKSWQELGMPAEIMEPFHRQVASVFAGGGSVCQQVAYPTIYGEKTYEYVLDPIVSEGEVLAVMAVVREIRERPPNS